MFVRKSGPTTAYPNKSQTLVENDQFWFDTCSEPVAASGIQPSASTSAEILYGE